MLFDFLQRNSQCHCFGKSVQLTDGYPISPGEAVVKMTPETEGLGLWVTPLPVSLLATAAAVCTG